jgi:hypothetical protein
MNPEEDFFVVLTSDSSKTTYSNNTKIAFTCHIPTAYNLEGRWDVCLWSLSATSQIVQDNLMEDPPGSMLVYTDIVTDTVIGDVTASLLAVLPLPHKKAATRFKPANLAYHRVKVKQLTDISIKLADLSGKAIDFNDEDSIVVIELHFRRTPV